MGILEEIAWQIGYAVCHQSIERSFVLGGRQLPVCARDFGMFTAFTVTVLLARFLFRNKPEDDWRTRAFLFLLVLPALVDAATTYAGIRETSNSIRLITGAFAGSSLAKIAFSYYPGEFSLSRSGNSARFSGRLLRVYASVLPGALVPLSVYFRVDGLYFFWILVVSSSVVFTLTFLNTVLILLATGYGEGKGRVSERPLVFLSGFFLCCLELSVSNRLHAFIDGAL